MVIESAADFVTFCEEIRIVEREQIARLRAATARLATAIDAANVLPRGTSATPKQESLVMPQPPVLDDLASSVTAATTVMGSATTLINGIAARVQAAVDAAIANGATAEQLAPVQAEADALKAASSELATAVQANT